MSEVQEKIRFVSTPGNADHSSQRPASLQQDRNIKTKYFGIVSRPPTRECGSKGQVSSPKKNHAAAELRVIFGLMPALLFLSVLLKMNHVRNAKLKKCGHRVAFRY
ncbi:MAG: hypothetical protein IJQ32_00870 [Paludibacteraceae bacterium]|nr:hypothetical protein [Paludibacteraceae bacterium]